MSSAHFCTLRHRMFRPNCPFRVGEAAERVGLDLCAVPGRRRRHVAPALQAYRVHEVLVEVIDELASPVLERTADRDVVEDRQVLDVLAQAYAPGMRADRNPKLRG